MLIKITGLQHTKHWYGPLKVTFSNLCKLCIYDSTETMDGKRHVCHFHFKVTDKWQFFFRKMAHLPFKHHTLIWSVNKKHKCTELEKVQNPNAHMLSYPMMLK